MMKSASNKAQAARYLHILRTYAPLGFIVFLVAIYGFLGFRIVELTSSGADATAVSSKLQTVGLPRVDEDVVSKMLKLQDNSVSVKTLFEEARSNPFGE